jgi:hypothetical protein
VGSYSSSAPAASSVLGVQCFLPATKKGCTSDDRGMYDENIFLPIDWLELPTRPKNVLTGLKIKYIGELIQLTKKDLLRQKNCGKLAIRQIEEALGSIDLSLGCRVFGWNLKRRKGEIVPLPMVSLKLARDHLEEAVARLKGQGNDSPEARALGYARTAIFVIERELGSR